MMSFKHKIGAYHDPRSPFPGLAVDSCHIFGTGIQKVVAVNTELKDHFKRWRVVIIKRIVLADRILVKVTPIVLSLGA
jgi:hypothetical protein